MLSDDARWRRLHDRSWTCPCCGEAHGSVFDLACRRPDYWRDGEDYSLNSSALTSKHFLSEDFCILDNEHFFVRCVLEIPIVGAPSGEKFAYGVWSSLSEKNFRIYADNFDEGTYDGLGPWFGWLSNRLHGYPDTLSMKCQVHPKVGRLRPSVELQAVDHPLALEQREGLTFDRLLEIYALHGHDMRQALLD